MGSPPEQVLLPADGRPGATLAPVLGAGYGPGVKEHVHSGAKKLSLPYCLACERLTESAERMHCPGCGALYHSACAQRLSGCRTPGCAHAPAERPKVVAARRTGVETLCPYCRSETDDEPAVCPECGTAYHGHCAWTLKRCATLGCNGKLRGRVIRVNRERAPLKSDPVADGVILAVFAAQIPAWLLAGLLMNLVPREWELVTLAVTWFVAGVAAPAIYGTRKGRAIQVAEEDAVP